MRELLISDIQVAAFLVARGHEVLDTAADWDADSPKLRPLRRRMLAAFGLKETA